jgi:hypothetical protein
VNYNYLRLCQNMGEMIMDVMCICSNKDPSEDVPQQQPPRHRDFQIQTVYRSEMTTAGTLKIS